MGNLKNRGGSMSTGGKGIHDRAEGDFYATQPKTTKAFLDKFKLEGSILEPACGKLSDREFQKLLDRIMEVIEDYE